MALYNNLGNFPKLVALVLAYKNNLIRPNIKSSSNSGGIVLLIYQLAIAAISVLFANLNCK